jgi:DNA-binding response OmpR family regulator
MTGRSTLPLPDNAVRDAAAPRSQEQRSAMPDPAARDATGSDGRQPGPAGRVARRERVLVVDDSAAIREVVWLLLEDEGYEVASAANGEQALSISAEFDPDIIVLDVMMPGLDGMGMLSRLRKTSDTPVVFLSARSGVEATVEGLELGADDYLAKPFDPDELAARVRAVLRRAAEPQPAPTVTMGDVTVDFDRRVATRNGEAVQLGRMEWEVLRKLARSPGQVVLATDLLREIWGEGYVDDLQVLRICVSRLRRKLGGHPGGRSPLRTYRNVGYALDA